MSGQKNLPFALRSAMKNAAPEGVGTACPEPDRNTCSGGEG